jgi:hypothetical protein
MAPPSTGQSKYGWLLKPKKYRKHAARRLCAWCGDRLKEGKRGWTTSVVLFEKQDGEKVSVCSELCWTKYMAARSA